MKVSGFTFVKNAIKFDYPVVEAITSILPLCDEFVVAVGNSDDDTRQLVDSIPSEKIRVIDTVWDDLLRKGGEVLAVETNKAYDALSPSSDWAFYIQADEVIHERYHMEIRSAMEKWKDTLEVEGLVFNYTHFYGSYDYVGDSHRWYRKEVRVIRKDENIRSWRDAQGFRRFGRPLQVKPVDACVYHYGWVKPPKSLQDKLESFHRLWHNDKWIGKNLPKADEFDYSKIDSLALFTGTHPKVMRDRIERMNWQFTHDPSKKNLSFKSRLMRSIELSTGWRPGEYRNYRVI
jgi:hypothetical protein